MPRSPSSLAGVVSLRSARRRHLDFAQLACARFAADRHATGLSRTNFAGALSEALGSPVEPESVTAWETGTPPPSDIQLAADDLASLQEDGRPPVGGRGILTSVPHVFAAVDLEGPWVTGYQFHHGNEMRCHVDIAHIQAVSDRDVRITNCPPTPRTEGRVLPFRNEIEAEVANRHLVGHWRNTSDARYFGSLHLAILPGEAVMEGYYTGFGSDIEVSLGRWRWVRLDQASLSGVQLSDVVLRAPGVLYDLVASYSQYDAPLTVNDVREAA